MATRLILIIEDDRHIAEGLKLNLALQGYEVVVARDGVGGLRKWKEIRPDLIVLDIMLPGIDGLAVLQHIRLEDEKIPILILSAKSGSDDKIKGLAYGVDDYLSKPFNLEEFLLRVDRLLTRAAWSQGAAAAEEAGQTFTTIRLGDNLIDFSTLTAECKFGRIRLTEQEVKLLKLFFAHPNKPLSRKKLLELAWGYTHKISSRTVDNFIVRFRKYFEADPRKPVFFKSVRSIGYLFDPEGK
ncbi:MAG: response regulator transcription factor [Desulfobacteraceae bacterium]|jgi:DNA-binding response OmpR family regulator